MICWRIQSSVEQNYISIHGKSPAALRARWPVLTTYKSRIPELRLFRSNQTTHNKLKLTEMNESIDKAHDDEALYQCLTINQLHYILRLGTDTNFTIRLTSLRFNFGFIWFICIYIYISQEKIQEPCQCITII